MVSLQALAGNLDCWSAGKVMKVTIACGDSADYHFTLAPHCIEREMLFWPVMVPNAELLGVRFGPLNSGRFVALNASKRN